MTDEKKSDTKVSKRKPESSSLKVSAFIVAFVVATVFGSSIFAFWLAKNFTRSHILQVDKVVEIPAGSGVSKIADILVNEGVIDNALAFQIVLRFNKLDKGLKAGEYLFPAGVTPKKVARILSDGKSVLHRLTIVEGLTSTEVINLINGVAGLKGLVMQTPPEGSLLPETYSFPKAIDRQEIVEKMQFQMEFLLNDLWADRQDGLPFKTKQEAVVLASIVEKETGLSSERAKVAGVFVNRLKKKMRLQSDPTVSYGITLGQEPLGRALTRKDLKSDTDFNTYVIRGLPPTPICNPGRAALEAVLNPAQTDALYFVADGSGGHAFSKNLQGHNRNVAKWRKIERSRK